jgi:lipopolysaccharide/colanic/teichoic acid biosynthesis glycosyltransferase
MSLRFLPSGVPLQKRLFDMLLTIPGLLLISPLLGLITLIIWLTEGKPIFFTQLRPGMKGKTFKLYKFRTMRETRDENGQVLPDAQRITKLGKFLRETSMDELPELLNVLRGEMSLVGPRPLLVVYLDRYSPEQARRHEVLPGMAGWAQVNGRNILSWEDKFKLDVWYVDHWSLWLDLKILFITFWKVLKREGISYPGEATAKEFMGTQRPGTSD